MQKSVKFKLSCGECAEKYNGIKGRNNNINSNGSLTTWNSVPDHIHNPNVTEAVFVHLVKT